MTLHAFNARRSMGSQMQYIRFISNIWEYLLNVCVAQRFSGRRDIQGQQLDQDIDTIMG
jgi:hypothetical protein